MFSGCTVFSNSKETELIRCGHEASPSVDENIRVVLGPYCSLKVAAIVVSFEGHKNYFKL